MTIRSSTPLSRLLAAAGAATALAMAPHALGAQTPPGRLDRVGGPATLLRQTLTSMPDLRPLDQPELRQWEPAYRGEAVRLAPSRDWLGTRWSLRLAAVNDTIYRVTLETFLSDVAEADRLHRAVNELLSNQLGESVQETCSDFRWVAADGDAQLRLTDLAEGRRTRVVFTSSDVRAFAPR